MTTTEIGSGNQADTPTPRRQLLLNCVTAAVLAVTAMIMVHEAVHLVTGAILGHPSTMYAFGVVHAGSPSATDQALMAISAPVFSLVSGALLAWWLSMRHRGGFLHLVGLLFAFASMQEGVAYLCLTPFGVGDTGLAATVLDLPAVVGVAACLIGVAGMFGTARLFATHLARHAGPDHGDRMVFSLFTWLYGMVILMVLTVGYLAITPMEVSAAEQVAILSANTALLVFAPMANIFHRQVADVGHEPLRLPRFPVGGFVAVAALVGLNVALSTGFLALG